MRSSEDTGGRAEDDALRGLLQQADPARDLGPLDQQRIRSMEEDVMAVDEVTPVRRRFVVVAAGLVVAAAAVVVVVVTSTGNTSTGDTATTTFTAAAGDPSAQCLPVTRELLAQQQTAFEADVTAVADQQVTLEVVGRFTGNVDDRVVVRQPTEGQDDFSATAFELGGRYLLAANDGRIAACGLSGPADDELRRLYDQAFS